MNTPTNTSKPPEVALATTMMTSNQVAGTNYENAGLSLQQVQAADPTTILRHQQNGRDVGEHGVTNTQKEVTSLDDCNESGTFPFSEEERARRKALWRDTVGRDGLSEDSDSELTDPLSSLSRTFSAAGKLSETADSDIAAAAAATRNWSFDHCGRVSMIVRVKTPQIRRKAFSQMNEPSQCSSPASLCLFPVIPKRQGEELSSSHSAGPWGSIDDTEPAPAAAMRIAAETQTKDLVLVNPDVYGKLVPADMTMETARLVAHLSNVSSEHWAHHYRFDEIVWPNNIEGMEKFLAPPGNDLSSLARAIVDDALMKKISAVTFALGSAGSGKTHTLFGSASTGPIMLSSSLKHDNVYERCGFLAAIIEELLVRNRAASRQEGAMPGLQRQAFTLSMLEIVEEDVFRDLFRPSDDQFSEPLEPLKIRHPDQKGAIVQNLTENEIESIDRLEELLLKAFRSRSINRAREKEGGHGHIIATIKVFRREEDVVTAFGRRDACTLIQLVNLASIDHMDDFPSIVLQSSHNSCKTQRSTCEPSQKRPMFVRNSLSGLYRVLHCLAEQSRDKSIQSASYRDCTLVNLLRRALHSADSRAVVIGNVCPMPESYKSTVQTLDFMNFILSNAKDRNPTDGSKERSNQNLLPVPFLCQSSDESKARLAQLARDGNAPSKNIEQGSQEADLLSLMQQEMNKMRKQENKDRENLIASSFAKQLAEDEREKIKNLSETQSNTSDSALVSVLETKLDELNAQKKAAEDQILSLEQQIETEQVLKQEELKHLKDTAESFLHEKVAVEKKAADEQAELQSKMESYERKLVIEVSAKNEAEDELSRMRENVSCDLSSKGDSQREAQLEKLVEELKRQKQAMEDQVLSLEEQINSEQALKAAKAREVANLRKKAQISYDAKVLAEAHADNQRAQVQDQAAEIDKMKKQKEIDDRNLAFAESSKKKVEDELERVKEGSSSVASSVDAERAAYMEKRIQDLRKEKAATEDQLLDLESKLESEQRVKHATEKEVEQLREKADNLLQAKLAAEEETARQRSQSDAKLKQHKEITKAIVKAAKKQVVSAAFAKVAAENELNKIKSSSSGSSSASVDIEKVNDLENEVKQLKSEKKAIEDQVQSIEQKIQEDEVFNQSLVKTLRNEIEASEEKAANQSSKIKDKITEINLLKRQKEIDDEQLAAAALAKKLAEDELEKFRTTSSSHADRVAHLEMLVDKLKEDKEAAEKRMQLLERKAGEDEAARHAKIEVLNEKVQKSHEAKLLAGKEAVEQASRLRSKINQLEKEAEKYNKASVATNKEQRLNDELQKQIDELSEEKRSVVAQLKSLEEQVDSEHLSNKRLEAHLNKKIKALQEEVAHATTVKMIAEDELGKVKKTSLDAHSNLKKQVDDLILQKKEAENQVQRLEEQVRREQSLKQELREEFESSETSRKSLKNQMKALQGEVAVVQSTKVSAEAELEKLKVSSTDTSHSLLEKEVQDLRIAQKDSSQQLQFLQKQVQIGQSEKNKLRLELEEVYQAKLKAEEEVRKLLSLKSPEDHEGHPQNLNIEQLSNEKNNTLKLQEALGQMQTEIKELTLAKNLAHEQKRALEEKLEIELQSRQRLQEKNDELSALPKREKALVKELNILRLHSNQALSSLQKALTETNKKKELALAALVLAKEKLNSALNAKEIVEEELAKAKSESTSQTNSSDSLKLAGQQKEQQNEFKHHKKIFEDEIKSLKTELESAKAGRMQAEHFTAKLEREARKHLLEKGTMSKQILELRAQLDDLQKELINAKSIKKQNNSEADESHQSASSSNNIKYLLNGNEVSTSHTKKELLNSLQQENSKLKSIIKLKNQFAAKPTLDLNGSSFVASLQRERDLRIKAQEVASAVAIRAKASLDQQKAEIEELKLKLSQLTNTKRESIDSKNKY